MSDDASRWGNGGGSCTCAGGISSDGRVWHDSSRCPIHAKPLPEARSAAETRDWPVRCADVSYDMADEDCLAAVTGPHTGRRDWKVGDLVYDPKMGEGHVLTHTKRCDGTGFYCGYCGGMMSSESGYCEANVLQCECGGFDEGDHHGYLLAAKVVSDASRSRLGEPADAVKIIRRTKNGAIVEADGWSFASCPGCGTLVSEWLTEEGPDVMEFEECPMCVEASRDEEWWF